MGHFLFFIFCAVIPQVGDFKYLKLNTTHKKYSNESFIALVDNKH